MAQMVFAKIILYIFMSKVQTLWVAKLAGDPELLTGIFNWPQWKPI